MKTKKTPCRQTRLFYNPLRRTQKAPAGNILSIHRTVSALERTKISNKRRHAGTTHPGIRLFGQAARSGRDRGVSHREARTARCSTASPPPVQRFQGAVEHKPPGPVQPPFCGQKTGKLHYQLNINQINKNQHNSITASFSALQGRCTIYVQYLYNICTFTNCTSIVQLLYIYCTTTGVGTSKPPRGSPAECSLC